MKEIDHHSKFSTVLPPIAVGLASKSEWYVCVYVKKTRHWKEELFTQIEIMLKNLQIIFAHCNVSNKFKHDS